MDRNARTEGDQEVVPTPVDDFAEVAHNFWVDRPMVISHFARVQIGMAETGASGGLRVARFNRTEQDGSCAHRETRVTTTGRLIRIVCESCGHIGLRSYGGLRGPISRDRFAREADKCADPMVDLTGGEFQVVLEDRSYRPQNVFATQKIYRL